jgi:hypothetical protein
MQDKRPCHSNICINQDSVTRPAAGRLAALWWCVPVLSLALAGPVSFAGVSSASLKSSDGILTNEVAQDAALRQETHTTRSAQEKGRGEDWIFQQRAYPLGYIPQGAMSRARRQTAAAVKSRSKLAATGAPGVSPKVLGIGQAGVNFYNVGPAPIAGGQTTPPSPVSGRITDIAIAPDNVNHWLVGTAQGGVWETFNAGGSWAPLTDGEASLATGAVTFAPSNSQIVYVGTGEANDNDSAPGAGLLKSIDGGATWTLLGTTNFEGRGFTALCVDPSNPNNLVAATSSKNQAGRGDPVPSAPAAGLFRSVDGGTNWSAILNGGICGVVSAPGNFAVQYAADYAGNIFRSTNGWALWSIVSGPWTSLPDGRGRVALAFAPADPNVLFVSIEDKTTTNEVKSLGIWRTINALSSTPTWSQIPVPPAAGQLYFDQVLAVDPLDSRILYFGEVELWKFDGSGSGGVPLGTWSNIHTNLHDDIHVLKWATTGRLVCGCDGGIFYTDNRGASNWVDCNTTLAITAFFCGSIHQTSYPSLALGGAQDNGSSRWSGSNTWTFVGYGDGADNLIGDDPNHQAVSAELLFLTRSVTGGSPANFYLVTNGITDITNAYWISRVRRHPANENEVITGTDHIWRTDDFFSSAPGLPFWYANSPRLGSGIHITAIAFAPSDTTGKAYAYGTDDGRLAITYDGGATWLDLDRANHVPKRFITQLAFDPQNSAGLYVTLSGFDEGTPGQPGHVFYTDYAYAEQQGNPVTWKDVSPPVDLPHDALVLDPVNPKVIYVGTDLGVWRCWDAHTGGSTNWEHLGPANGLPNVAVFDLQFHGPARRLFAFTHGRGLFVADLIPGNDNWSSAEFFSDATGTRLGTTVNATKEPGEPSHAGASGSHSVWFQWTPTNGGLATIDTLGSAFGAVLAVYGPGSSWNGLALPALASDNGNAGGGASRIAFPAVRNKTYYIAVDGTNSGAFGSFNLNYSTVIDSVSPVITFSPLTNQQVVFNFNQLAGTVSKTAAVNFKIEWFRAAGNMFWNGVNWTSVESDSGVLLPANVSGLNWTPASGTLPPRSQLAQANYVIYIYATDVAGNNGDNNIVLTRSPLDTTPPIVTLDNIHDGDVFTNLALPALTGSALDYESGVASVNVYLNRFTSSGILYWNGSSWSSNPAVLPASYNAQTVAWQVSSPLPGGGNLPNGSYQVQVSVQNNEAPAGTALLSVSFSVDYHPVFVFNYGSQYGLTPNMNWTDPANWDVGSVPPPEARVVINGYSPNNTSMGSVTQYGVDLSAGTLTTSGMLIQRLNLYGGALAGGAISIPTGGVFNWSGGTIIGDYQISAGAALNLSGSNDLNLAGATIYNAGTATWTGTGQIKASAGSLVDNTGTFNLQNDSTFYNYTGGGAAVFNNSGTIRKTVATGQTVISPLNSGWTLNNSGLIDIQTGVVSSQSQFNLNAGGTYSGAGETRVDGGVATMNGSNYITAGNPIELANGTMNGTGTFNGPGNFVWSGGTMQGNDGIGGTGHLLISGSAGKQLNGTFSNAGQAVWGGAGDVTISAGSIFNNSGTFTTQDGAQFYNYTGGGAAYFVNSGTFIKSGVTNATTFANPNSGVAFNNLGNITAQTGVLALSGGGVSSNATFNALAGGRIEFSGGTHYINGGLTFSGAGVTRINNGAVNSLGGTNTIASGGTFELASGSLDGVGSFAGPGLLSWTGGSITAVLFVQTNLPIAISGSNDVYLTGGTIHNAGTVTWTGAGQIIGSAGSLVDNTGTFNLQNDSTFYNYTGGGAAVFNNSGTIRKTVATGQTVISLANSGWTLNNSGLMDVQTGIVSSQSQFNLNAGGTFSGAGETRVDSAVATLNGSSSVVAGGTLELANGTMNGTGTLNGPGTFKWTGGYLSGVLTLQSSLTTACTGANDKSLAGGTITNLGTFIWTGSGQLAGAAGSVVNNIGLFNIQNDSTFYNYTGGGPVVFNNPGTIRKTVATGQTTISGQSSGWTLNHSGLMDIQTGIVSSQAQLNLNAGGTFSGAGETRVDSGGATMNGSTYVMAGSPIELANGTMNGTGTFNGPGNFVWSGGTMEGNNGIGSTGHLLLTGSAGRQLNGTFSNAGAAVWSGAGEVDCNAGSIFNNSGTFTAQNGAQFYNTTGGGAAYFVNTGTFIKSGVTNATTFANPNSGVAFNNLGSITAQIGVLALSGGGVSSNATFNALAGARIEIGGVTHFFNGGLTFTGAGVTRITNGAVNSLGGTNTIAGGGTFELASGSLDGVGGFAGPGLLSWTGGNITAILFLQTNLPFAISGPSDKTLAGGTIHNAGTVTWTGAGQINGAAGSLVDNAGTFNLQNDSTFYNYSGGGAVAFTNSGTIRKTVATGQTVISPANSGWTLNNSGLIDVQTGVVSSQSQFNLNAGGTFSGAGETRVDSAVATLNGSSSVVAGGTLELANGTMNGTGTLNGPGTFKWTGGSITSVLTLQSNLTTACTGANDKPLAGRTINNLGTFIWTGSGMLLESAGSVFNNSGLFNIQNDSTFYNYTGGGTAAFNNSGTIRKTSATGTTTISAANSGVNFNNTGAVDLRSGTLAVNAGYATSLANQLRVSIGGLSANTQFGQETFGDNAIFDGTLVLSLTNGFTPTNGSSFALVNYPSRSGQFATTQFPPLPLASRWQLSYTPNALLALVVPATAFQTVSLTNGHFQFGFAGQTGSRCLIEASTNLANWFPLLTNAPFNGSLNFVDPQTPLFPKRYYRATVFP